MHAAIRTGAILALILSAWLYPLAASPDALVDFINSYAAAWTKVFRLNYVFVGDSITRGNATWFASLRTNPVGTVNLARSGYTIEQLVPIVRQAAAMHPETILYMAGTNDILFNSAERNQTIKSFAETADILAASGARVIVTLSPPMADASKTDDLKTLNESIRDIAMAKGFRVIDLWPQLLAGNAIAPQFTIDGVHFTKAAYALWAAALRDAISAGHPVVNFPI